MTRLGGGDDGGSRDPGIVASRLESIPRGMIGTKNCVSGQMSKILKWLSRMIRHTGIGDGWRRTGRDSNHVGGLEWGIDTGAQIRFKMGDLAGRDCQERIGLQNGTGPCTDVKRTA